MKFKYFVDDAEESRGKKPDESFNKTDESFDLDSRGFINVQASGDSSNVQVSVDDSSFDESFIND